MKTAALHNYAEALYEQAAARDELPRSLAALEAAAEVLAAEPELQRLVAHPGISDVRKGELFRAAMGEHDTPLMQDFFQLLLQQQRIAQLAGIAAAFRRVLEERSGRQPVLVESAAPLTAGQVERLENALAAIVGQPAAVTWRVVPELLGGLRLRINSEVLDETLSGRLTRLQEYLTGALNVSSAL
ncbi:MAG: ATP synthase F1 subunit delta [candidate division WS1 bacterium]|jgi:F-type H+-transporting ATPase subunit delta|nr:ATP synthase F1 subunit delta [candidate division WS1 bacterium]